MKNKIKNNNRRKRLQKLAKEVVPALDLESLIEKERVCLTDAIKYSTSGGIQSLNYYNFWEMDGRKTNENQGYFVLVDDEGASIYFRKAFEKKHGVYIPETKFYDKLINRTIDRYRIPNS